MSNQVQPLGTVGLGFVPPSKDALLQAGALAPANTVLGCLQQLVSLIGQLVSRLAPPLYMQGIQCDGLIPGAPSQPLQLTGSSFNGFLVVLSQGKMRVYLGGSNRGPGFIDLPAAAIPYHVHFPAQSNNQLTLVNVDPVNTAEGTVYPMQY